MEKPTKVVYSNGGQTKVTLTGKLFFMSGDEIAAEYESRLEAGDPWAANINDTLCEINESIARRGA